MTTITTETVYQPYNVYGKVEGYWGEITIWGSEGSEGGQIYIEGPRFADNPQRAVLDDFGGGNSNYFARFNLPDTAGEYIVGVGDKTTILEVTEEEANGPTGSMGFGWNGNLFNIGWETGYSEKEQDDYDPTPGLQIDPANYKGIVNSDNELGFDLAPYIKDEEDITIDDVKKIILNDGKELQVDRGSKVIEIGGGGGQEEEESGRGGGNNESPNSGGSGNFPSIGGGGKTKMALGVAGVAVAYKIMESENGTTR